MRASVSAWLWIVLLALEGDDGITKPIFFELPVQFHDQLVIENIGDYMEESWFEGLELQLVMDGGLPKFYESSFRTTVCDDEVCEIMSMRLLWDLVGNYVGYDTLPGHPLTKFDHKPFEQEDYIKLHELLLNEGSILKFKKKEELIDKQKVKASDVIDGTTGATAVEIREEVVEGALYSSYTLWHLAYSGPIKNLLTAHTKKLFDTHLKQDFLASGREGYRLFAFQQFTPEDFERYKPEWLKALRTDAPLIRKFILRSLPDAIWKSESIQNEICLAFLEMDVNTKTIVLNKLKSEKVVAASNLEILSGFVAAMNKNQTAEFLGFLKNSTSLSSSIRKNLVSASQDPRYRYDYLVDEYLAENNSIP